MENQLDNLVIIVQYFGLNYFSLLTKSRLGIYFLVFRLSFQTVWSVIFID